jgi:hypothetical protein
MIPYFTLTAPGGHVIAMSEDRRVVEDRFARIIQEDGFPDGTSGYAMRHHWMADGRFGAKGQILQRIVLGCDDTGWWQLDGSKVPATASPARFLNEGGALNRLERFIDSGNTDALLEGLRPPVPVSGGPADDKEPA